MLAKNGYGIVTIFGKDFLKIQECCHDRFGSGGVAGFAWGQACGAGLEASSGTGLATLADVPNKLRGPTGGATQCEVGLRRRGVVLLLLGPSGSAYDCGGRFARQLKCA